MLDCQNLVLSTSMILLTFSKVNARQLVSYAEQFQKVFKNGNVGALTRDQAALIVKTSEEARSKSSNR